MPDILSPETLAATRKRELVNHVASFYRASWNWRSQRRHQKWDKYDRAYHSIYDPTLLAQKEPWQMKMFIGITGQNVELITSQIYKTMMAPQPPIQTEAGPAGDELQAELIQDVIDYQLRRSQFNLSFYDTLKEAVKYGSGFMKLFWERVEDVRQRRIPVNETPEEVMQKVGPDQILGNAPMPNPGIKGFQMQDVPVLLKNNLCAKYVHIRDIFPEPNSTTWDKVIHRDKIPYGTIVQYMKTGAFFDVRDQLENAIEGEKFEVDQSLHNHERGYFEQNRDLAKFEKKHTVWEFWGQIPRKWVEFDIPEGDDAEVLVPAKVMVASGVALLASEINKKFDGEVPILKLDYIRTGETYGKGIPEIIEDEQDEINELRNLRVDNVNLIMNKMIAVIESALVNAEDIVSKPGGVIRLKAQWDDVRRAIMPLEFQNVTQNAYQETLEIERGIQERTGANRVTLGSSGLVKDTNQTLGGMELLKQMFNERIAAYGMVMETAFLMKAAEKIYGLIYQELKPEDMKPILGEKPVEIAPPPMPGMLPISVPRFMAFAFVPPEEINRSYRFKPMGIFTLENKVVKSAQLMDAIKMGLSSPLVGMNVQEALKFVTTKLQGISEAEKWFSPIPMMPIPPGIPGLPPPTGNPGTFNKKDVPGMKGGENGNGAAFAPPNPVRREPVVS